MMNETSTSSSSTAGPSIQPGGILDVAQPMDVSKVMLVCPKCDRPTRIKHSTLADALANIRLAFVQIKGTEA